MDEEHGFRCGRVHVDTRLNVSNGVTDNSKRVILWCYNEHP